jgi:predicted enzyme related to lactoylglutathione lyase
MSEVRRQELPEIKPGSFCWVELGTTDVDGAKNFYKQLFGWDYDDQSMGPSGVYTIIKLNGKDVGGLYQLSSEMLEQGLPPHWLSYISVANADDATAQAISAGGSPVKEPFDVGPNGRMAVIQDPTKAAFALWQAKEHAGAAAYRETGALCWNELGTTDSQKAGDFYTTLFGWEREVLSGPMEYTVFKNNGEGIGGMYQITPEMGPMPPHWIPYFAVNDCDATVQKTSELGGRILRPAEDIPNIGRYAILQDPSSAAFAIIKPMPPSA